MESNAQAKKPIKFYIVDLVPVPDKETFYPGSLSAKFSKWIPPEPRPLPKKEEMLWKIVGRERALQPMATLHPARRRA